MICELPIMISFKMQTLLSELYEIIKSIVVFCNESVLMSVG